MTEQRELLPTLHPDQVERLLSEPSAETRADTATIVAGLLNNVDLSESERALALDVITVLARDVSERVRQAVCESMMRSPLLPPEIARQLADDVEKISVPLLMVTDVLCESDFIDLVHKGNIAKQLAIAQRAYVSERLSDALIATENGDVVTALLSNPAAEIAEHGYHRIIDTLQNDQRVQQAIVGRLFIPLTVTHRLIQVVSEELREEMVKRLRLPTELVESFLTQGQQSTLTRIVRRERRIEEVEHLVDFLRAEGRLSASLVLRTLLEGDLHFFESALAKLADVSLRNTRVVLHDGGHVGLSRLYQMSGLPDSLHHAFQIAVGETYRFRASINRGDAQFRQEELTQRIIDQLIVDYREICSSDLEAVIAQLSRLGANTAAAGA